MESILKASGIKKYYGKGDTMVKALDGIDLEIERGKCPAGNSIRLSSWSPTIPILLSRRTGSWGSWGSRTDGSCTSDLPGEKGTYNRPPETDIAFRHACAWRTTQRYISAQKTRTKYRRCYTAFKQHLPPAALSRSFSAADEGYKKVGTAAKMRWVPCVSRPDMLY